MMTTTAVSSSHEIAPTSPASGDATDDRPSVLVIGATGMIGRPVTRVLVEEGFRVRAMVRKLARGWAVLPDEVECVAGDLREPDSVRAAMEGMDAVYLSLAPPMGSSAPEWDPELDGTRTVVEQAPLAGVKRVLRLSAMGVEEAAEDWWAAANKLEADLALEASDLDWTVFRPTWFMESIPASCVGPVLIQLPAPGDRIWWIAGRDFGRMVAAALRRPETAGRIYRVQGCDPRSVAEAYARFAEIWKDSLVRVPMPEVALKLGAKAVPMLEYLERLLDLTFSHAVKEPGSVEGRDRHQPTITVEQYARELRHDRDFPSKAPF